MDNTILEPFIQAKESILKDVVFQCLNREPVMEDYKRFTLVHKEGDWFKEWLMFDHVCVGVFETIYEGLKITLTFNPIN